MSRLSSTTIASGAVGYWGYAWPLTQFFPFLLDIVVPGFRVLGFRALPGFRALNPGNGGWLVHKTLFGFRARLFWPFCPFGFSFGGLILSYLVIFT